MSKDSHSQKVATNVTRSWLPVILGIVVVVGSGTLYGHYSQRWGPPADLQAAGSHLKTLPARLGEWRLEEELPMDAPTLSMLECAGYLSRRYSHQVTGQTVSVAITVGPPGPTAVHTPEICYSSRNYEIQSKRIAQTLTDQQSNEHTFWNVELKTRDQFAERLSVYYAWSLGDTWEAARSPRYKFAAHSKLFKIQLATLVPPNSTGTQEDPCNGFLKALLNSGWNLAGT